MTPEQAEVLEIFTSMLRCATEDGGRKRAAGLKPSWKIDKSHETAIFSHLNKWKHGEKIDPDSGAHPLVHLAWRALAIAYQETHPPAISSEQDAVAEAMDHIDYFCTGCRGTFHAAQVHTCYLVGARTLPIKARRHQ